MGFIWRVIQQAAWPGIAVLIVHEVFGRIFGHEPYVDPVMHLLGGAAAAFFFIRVPALAPKLFGEPSRTTLYLLGFGLTSAVAMIWEFGEFLSDFYLGTRIQRSLGNTMTDLSNGMAGAMILIFCERMLHRSTTKLRSPSASN
jgi:hypothetical protein